jgi:hypothetical protein
MGDVLSGHLHVKLHGGRIRMDLDDRHLGSFVVDVSIEGDQARLVRFDRFHELSEGLLEVLELAVLDPMRA